MSTRRIRLDVASSLASLVMLTNLFFFCSWTLKPANYLGLGRQHQFRRGWL